MTHAIDAWIEREPEEPDECNGSVFCDCDACMDEQAQLDARFLAYLRRCPA